MTKPTTTRSRAFTIALAALLLLYPALVYFGLQHFGPRSVAGLILVIVLLRTLTTASLGGGASSSHWLLLAASVATLGTLVTGSDISLKFYPVMVSLTLLLVFATSLWKPPTVIERIARLQDPQLPPEGVNYTRVVTWVWCGFFVFNGTVATITAFSSDRIWAIYNGFISYLLMGALFSLEYLIRRQRIHQHDKPDPV